MAYIKGKLGNYPCFCDKSEKNKEFTKNKTSTEIRGVKLWKS